MTATESDAQLKIYNNYPKFNNSIDNLENGSLVCTRIESEFDFKTCLIGEEIKVKIRFTNYGGSGFFNLINEADWRYENIPVSKIKFLTTRKIIKFINFSKNNILIISG